MSSRKDPKRKRGEGSENSKANDGTSLQNEETGDEAQMMINAAPLVLRLFFVLLRPARFFGIIPHESLMRNC